ncbi:hypothetical protein J3998_02010 [Thiomicrorhabdus sp. 6S2-11]|uniref:Uncharacterized protein n=1 Tax=Thiomicrorhabdus marina TaxID=2818442 RepID=A0ABS3Q1Z5_9GAMM|nr:hypothetical protein [Thiomicrorhabdus marina]
MTYVFVTPSVVEGSPTNNKMLRQAQHDSNHTRHSEQSEESPADFTDSSFHSE